MKKRHSKLKLSKKVISVLNISTINGGRPPKTRRITCDSLLEQTFTEC
ncbi:hypothetical protein [uncultured Kordia sp.]|nr:hypothetical protein [uncultured Kordia sp.]